MLLLVFKMRKENKKIWYPPFHNVILSYMLTLFPGNYYSFSAQSVSKTTNVCRYFFINPILSLDSSFFSSPV